MCTVLFNGLVHPLGEPLDDWQVQEGREIRRPLVVASSIAAAAARLVAAVAVGGVVLVVFHHHGILLPQHSFSGCQRNCGIKETAVVREV